VFANSSWVPLFSVLVAGTSLPTGSNQWANASRLQQLDLASAETLPLNGSSNPSFAVKPHSSPRYLYGAVPVGSWRVQVDGHQLATASAFGWASLWGVPAGTTAVALSQPGTGAQHAADIAMVLAWAIALSVALLRLRTKRRAQLTRTSQELSPPGADVPEIDWSSVWEEQSVG
jgi:hypothetical protein